MTKKPKLYGNDADYIFRKLLDNHFSVKTYPYIYNNKTITVECCDFNTIDDDKVIETCNKCYNKWVEIIENTPEDVKKCDTFVRYDLDSKENNEKKIEFTELNVRYDYQNECFNWINSKAFEGINEDYYINIPCGGGKTSISMCGLVLLSKYLDYRPILVLSGLNCVKGAFEADSLKYTYYGIEVKVYDIDSFDLSEWEKNKKAGIVSIVCTTCQSSVKSRKEENYDVVDEGNFNNKDVQNLSHKLIMLLDSGVRFSCGITDEAHKIVFGDKMKSVFPLIRFYHKDKGLNFFHMSGTGFSIDHKFSKNKKYEIDFCEIQKEQGDAAVRRHFIVCKNNMFLPYFYSNIEKGWDILLDEECDVDSNFKNVDSINCISSIKYGLVKPVIVAYLERQSDVRNSFDYLHKKYSFDNVLIISANGCKDKCDKFVRNDVNGNICEISNENAHTEVTSQVKQAVAENKMVILLNVNKFVESWTISEMNVQLILRNIKSPDTFGQAICRPSRIYVHEKYVIKTDAFIFLYGDTFVTMSYEYNNLLKQNSIKKTTKPIKFLCDGDVVYMDGVTYTHGNLNELDKLIRCEVMRLNRTADGFSSLLMRKYPNAFKEIIERGDKFFKNTVTYGGSSIIKAVDTQNIPQTQNGDVPVTQSTPPTQNGDVPVTQSTQNEIAQINKNEEKKQLAQIKTFITNLQIEVITSYYMDSLKYDNLVNCMKENAAKDNKVTECERMLSECFGDNYEEFKRDVESWLENWIETIN